MLLNYKSSFLVRSNVKQRQKGKEIVKHNRGKRKIKENIFFPQ